MAATARDLLQTGSQGVGSDRHWIWRGAIQPHQLCPAAVLLSPCAATISAPPRQLGASGVWAFGFCVCTLEAQMTTGIWSLADPSLWMSHLITYYCACIATATKRQMLFPLAHSFSAFLKALSDRSKLSVIRTNHGTKARVLMLCNKVLRQVPKSSMYLPTLCI